MARKSKRKHAEDEFHFSASESEGDDFFSTRPGFESLYSMEQMKERYEKAGIEIPDSDDEGVRLFGQDTPVRRKRMRRRLDEEEQKKGRNEARRKKGRRKTEEKKSAAAVFDLDDSDNELVEVVTGRDVMKEDAACRRAAALLERNRKIIQGDWSGEEKWNGDDNGGGGGVDDDDDVVLVSEEKADKVKASKEKTAVRANHSPRNSQLPEGKPLLLKLRCAEHSATTKVMNNLPLSEALKAFCQRYRLEYSSARMEIDGEIVGEKETPLDYDLEDRSIVDIYTK